MKKLIEHKRVIQKLLKLNVPKIVKHNLVRDYTFHFMLGMSDKKQKQSRIAGLTVPYCTIDNFEYLFNEVFVRHEYWVPMNNETPVIIDGGSNIGVSVCFFHLLWPKATILAFEPQPDAFKCLSDFIELNDLNDRITAYCTALGYSDGTVDFFVENDRAGSVRASSLYSRMPEKMITVKTNQLSKFIENDVDLLKLDIEGGEFDVLRELLGANKLKNIRRIIMEYHHHIEANEDKLSDTLQILETSGFGYQIECKLSRPYETNRFKDMTIFAYAK